MPRRTSLVIACFCVLLVGAWMVPLARSIPRRPAPGVRSVPVPAAGRPVGTSHPSRVVGRGTAASCTSAAVVAAVRAGGIIRFSCGPKPVTIRMTTTAKVMNTSPQVVLDGGGLVTLSGEGRHRILYMDTCDPAQVWTTSHCQDQASPKLVIRNLAFTDGDSNGQLFDGGGGGAIFDRGGRLRIVNSVFTGNRCEHDGPDIGGGAVRALSQYQGLPVYVVNSRFTGNVCSNGGALSSIGVSWTVLNSRFLANLAIGIGANPAQPGTPGGGSGGAIYNDGDSMTLSIGGSLFVNNRATEGGGAIFFVSDDRTGTMAITGSTLERNPNDQFHTAGLPGIFFLGARSPTISESVVR
jgi:predicted outer membrane repeat protein